MRTQEEILQKIEDVTEDDFLGHVRGDLIKFLDFENAKQFLKDGVTEEEWNEIRQENTEEVIRKAMDDYLGFAFEKAKGERGLSASRSMDHYSAWIWLLDEEKRFGDVTDYHSYGIPHLYEIKRYLQENRKSDLTAA